MGPPSWVLVKVLTHLHGSTFEPLRLANMKVSFLLALAVAKRVGELQALSCRVASYGPDISLAYLPRSILVKCLEDFAGDLPEECLLCPVRAVRTYLSLISSILPCPCLLLVSPRRPSHALLKNALSFFIRQVILDAGAMEEGALPPLAHSVCAVATSAAFLRN